MLSIKKYHLLLNNGDQEFSLYNVNIDIEDGGSLILRGKNGSGKTTLLNAISHRLPKNAIEKGEILFNNKNVLNDNVSYLDINADIIPNITVYEHLLLGLKSKNIFYYFLKKEQKEIITKYFNKHLKSYFELFDYCGSFSKGEKAILLIAATLINPNKIVLLDEPTANLDEENRHKVIELIKDIWGIKKFILIIASHDPQIKNIFNNSLFLKIIKKGDRAIIPTNDLFIKTSTYVATSNNYEFTPEKALYLNFVEVASKNWEFGVELNENEKEFLAEDFNNKKILIVGCGIGREAIYLQNNYNAHISCLDISLSMLDQCSINTNGKLYYIKSDICEPNNVLLSNYYDIIICLGNTIGGFLEYEEREIFFNNCYTLLKDEGLLIWDTTLATPKTYDYYNSHYKCHQVKMDYESFGLFIDYIFNKGLSETLYQHYLSLKEIEILVNKSFLTKKSKIFDYGFERIMLKCEKIIS